MILRLAFLSLIRRPARNAVLLLLLAAAAALPVFLLQLAGGLYAGLNRAVAPFPILSGAKGSPYQLVINTVFLRDAPIGNISYAEVTRLRESGKTDLVLPLAFGDNVNGFRLVGTEPEIFSYAPNKKDGAWLTVAEGKPFAAEHEAVLGSAAARALGLSVGDTFHTMHGLTAGGKKHEHKEEFLVSGILSPVAGPYDTAVLVNIEDIWEMHGHGHDHENADEHTHGAEDADGHEHEEKIERNEKDVTAILVHPKGYKEAMQLLSAAQRDRGGETQIIFPSQTLIALYVMAGQSREFWEILSAGLIGAAVLITLLAMYWAGLARKKEFLLLRALGASRRMISRMLLAEEAFLLAAGAAAGWLLGWGGSVLAANAVSSRAAIVMETAPQWESAIPPLAIFLLGLLAGLLPLRLLCGED